MTEYELTFVLQPDMEEPEEETFKTRLNELVTGNGGEITSARSWGRRRLAYQIGKHTSGLYITLRFTVPPEAVEEIQRFLRLSEDVLRFLVLRAEEVPDPS